MYDFGNKRVLLYTMQIYFNIEILTTSNNIEVVFLWILQIQIIELLKKYYNIGQL